mmetsp:Transcript_42054/g.65763  ORF Transcript_42054/g.65763 Transcript_42054/m.65763 type:complete len:868 (+) Transcript_42054:96-2699(+)
MVKITTKGASKAEEPRAERPEEQLDDGSGGSEVQGLSDQAKEKLRAMGAEMAGSSASRVPQVSGVDAPQEADSLEAEGLSDDEDEEDLGGEGLDDAGAQKIPRSSSPPRPSTVPKLNIAAAVAIQAAEGAADTEDEEEEGAEDRPGVDGAEGAGGGEGPKAQGAEEQAVTAVETGHGALESKGPQQAGTVGHPAPQAPGYSMSNVLVMTMSVYLIISFAQLYLVFRPKPCTSIERKCLYPLFGEDDAVDIFIHTSLSASLGGAVRNQIWNATGVRLKEASVRAVANVQMPPQARANDPFYAHVTIVRAGYSPDLKDHAAFKGRDHRYRSVHPYRDILFFSTPITEKMVPLGSNHSMLLKGRQPIPQNKTSSQSSNSTQTEHWSTIDEHQIVQLIAILLLGFSLLGLLRPSAGVASLRALILVAVALLSRPYVQWAVKKMQSTPVERSKLELPAFSAPKKPMVHLKPQIRLRFVGDWNLYPENELPMSHLSWNPQKQDLNPKHYSVHPMLDEERSWRFVPMAYEDCFGLQKKRYIPVAADGKGRPDPRIEIQFQTQGLHTFQAMRFLEGSFSMMKSHGLDERDMDDVKDLVSDQSLKVLGLTYLITFLHMIFDFLAFKNDIGFYRGRETYEGISTRSLLSNFVCSVIIFLYLLDNEYTSRIILGSTFISTLIEGWKAKKVSKARFVWVYFQPWVVSGRGYAGPGGASMDTVAERRTDEIDAQGMKWLQRTLYPLVAGWAIYSLLTRPHKSWWSWAIHSLANGVYTFGFIAMTPQLFVNYKLKSVAHLPWRAFMYKAFNTFIDDVFSWIMTMPMSHRIACLRDDVVFFVYLYQRWLYPVDKSRPNEFGFVYEDEAAKEGENGEESKKDK